MSIILIERVSSFLIDNPIADRVSVKAVAITTGAGTLVADNTIKNPEMLLWLGITPTNWAAILSIFLVLLTISEKVIKYVAQLYRWNKKRVQLKAAQKDKLKGEELANEL